MYIYKLDKKNVSSFGNNEIDYGNEWFPTRSTNHRFIVVIDYISMVQTNLNYENGLLDFFIEHYYDSF